MLPCHESNVTAERSCYGHGQCSVTALYSSAETGCACDQFYTSQTFCKENVFALTGSAPLILSAASVVCSSLMALWIALEIGLDFKFTKFSWKKPTLLAKINLFVFNLVVLAIGSLELKTSLAPQEVYGGLAIVFLHLVAIVLICLEFNMVVVSWITILVRAKTLGEKKILSLRRALMGIMGALAALFLVLFIVRAFGLGGDLIMTVAYATCTVYVFANIIIATIYMFKLKKWVSKNPKKEVMRKVHRRNKLLIAILVFVFIMVLSNFVAVVVTNHPWSFLCTWILERAVLVVQAVLYILFLENYFFSPSPFQGYIVALKGSYSDSNTEKSQSKILSAVTSSAGNPKQTTTTTNEHRTRSVKEEALSDGTYFATEAGTEAAEDPDDKVKEPNEVKSGTEEVEEVEGKESKEKEEVKENLA